MANRRASIEIGHRAAKEVWRLCGSCKEARERLGCGEHKVREWEQGVAPSAIYLARLCEMGADVIWILTGKRGKEIG